MQTNTQASPAITITATFDIGKGKTETVVGNGANLPAAKLALVDAYDEYLNGFACHAVYDASMATIAKKGIMAYLRSDPCCTVTITDNTATPVSRFLARAQFVRELAELLQIATNAKGDLVFTNPARDVQFFDQLAQYDAENSI